MSTDNNFPMANFDGMSEDQAREYIMKFHKKSKQNLEEKSLEKLERERIIQENIFRKMNTGEISAAPASEMAGTVPPFQPPPEVPSPEILMEASKKIEENIPFIKVNTLKNVGSGTASPPKAVTPTEPIRATQQLNRDTPKSSTPVNDENEPTGIQWRPTTIQQLVALYPKSEAVSDLWMTVHGAGQQPGMAFGLIAPHGTKYFIKSDKSGNLFMADPDPNPQAFANVGLNPDMDNDAVDDKNGIEPAKPFNQNSWRVLPSKLESKETEFGKEDVHFNESIEESRMDLSKIEDEKTRKVVEKLYAEADELRKKAKEETLTESKEETVSVKKLNGMLLQAQSQVNSSAGAVYEAVADELSDLIAEALLSNKNTVPLRHISPIILKMKW